MKVEIMSGRNTVQAFERVSKVILLHNNRIEIHHEGIIDEMQLPDNLRADITGNQSIRIKWVILDYGGMRAFHTTESSLRTNDMNYVDNESFERVGYYIGKDDIVTIEAVE